MANGSKNVDDRKMQTLLEMGFYPGDCREALEAAGGDSAKALEILLASEARVWHKQTARRINSYLNKVKLLPAVDGKSQECASLFSSAESSSLLLTADRVGLLGFSGSALERILRQVPLPRALAGACQHQPCSLPRQLRSRLLVNHCHMVDCPTRVRSQGSALLGPGGNRDGPALAAAGVRKHPGHPGGAPRRRWHCRGPPGLRPLHLKHGPSRFRLFSHHPVPRLFPCPDHHFAVEPLL